VTGHETLIKVARVLDELERAPQYGLGGAAHMTKGEAIEAAFLDARRIVAWAFCGCEPETVLRRVAEEKEEG